MIETDLVVLSHDHVKIVSILLFFLSFIYYYLHIAIYPLQMILFEMFFGSFFFWVELVLEELVMKEVKLLICVKEDVLKVISEKKIIYLSVESIL